MINSPVAISARRKFNFLRRNSFVWNTAHLLYCEYAPRLAPLRPGEHLYHAAVKNERGSIDAVAKALRRVQPGR